MTIGLPHDVILHLGEDVPAEFPPVAASRSPCPICKRCSPRSIRRRTARAIPGAVDWSALPDRLHYIVDLFRCYHESADLFDPPFTAEQVAALKAGRLPEGRL